jgi:xanthine dehydrogenase accessory factor
MFCASLADFLTPDRPAIRILLTRVRGSSPRGAGTEMFVTHDGLWGTIGGGRLEHGAVERARAMLRDGEATAEMDVPLGPEIGQCCGGRVELSLQRMGPACRAAALDRARIEGDNRPHVHVLGAGHVGRALADLFQHLPVRCILIDSRAGELAQCAARVEKHHSAIPEADIATAPPGSAFIVLTHDHGLDFLLTAAALGRGDAAYVGMIGSATKRAKFASWARDHGDGQSTRHLHCPIGAGGSHDKRPGVIAAFVVAEVIGALTSGSGAAADCSGQLASLPLAGQGTGRARASCAP